MKDLKRLKEEYLVWNSKYNDARERRLSNCEYTIDEEHELDKQYRQWKTDNDIWSECTEWGKEINYGYRLPQDVIDEDYRDWFSNDDIFDSMVKSVQELPARQVTRFIDRLKCKYEQDHLHELDDIIDYLQTVFWALGGYSDYDPSMLILSVDVLENYDFWKPYRESFYECLKNIAEFYNVDLNF